MTFVFRNGEEATIVAVKLNFMCGNCRLKFKKKNFKNLLSHISFEEKRESLFFFKS